MDRSFVVNSITTHSHTIILLHSRGSTGEEFAGDLIESTVPKSSGSTEELNLRQRFPTCKWVFPSAKLRYSTAFEEELTAWFDVFSLTNTDERQGLQVEGLVEAVTILEQIIAEESKQISPQNLILGGTSQGYATASLVLIGLDLNIGGFLGLSGWIPLSNRIVSEGSGVPKEGQSLAGAATAVVRDVLGITRDNDADNAQRDSWTSTSIFLGHERHDMVVSCELGEAAHNVFEACGGRPHWHVYESGRHWIQEPDEVSDIVDFITKCKA